MSVADLIRLTTSPMEAFLVVADALDNLIEKVSMLGVDVIPAPADPWGSWDKVIAPGFTVEVQRTAIASQDTSAERIRAALAEATDPEDVQALTAKLRLAEDPGTVPHAVAGALIQETDGVVELPPPTPELAARRAKWAIDVRLGDMLDPPMDLDAAARAYAKGGPMWLYLGDREAMLGMPDQWLRMFVADVHEQSPRQAQELARDILKAVEPDGNMAPTLDTMANQVSS